jgi:hypothetical protein
MIFIYLIKKFNEFFLTDVNTFKGWIKIDN